jgi:hypothetical protein
VAGPHACRGASDTGSPVATSHLGRTEYRARSIPESRLCGRVRDACRLADSGIGNRGERRWDYRRRSLRHTVCHAAIACLRPATWRVPNGNKAKIHVGRGAVRARLFSAWAIRTQSTPTLWLAARAPCTLSTRFLDAEAGEVARRYSVTHGATAPSGVSFQDRADSSGATMRPLWLRPPGGDLCPVELAVIDAPWGVSAGSFPSASTGIGSRSRWARRRSTAEEQ